MQSYDPRQWAAAWENARAADAANAGTKRALPPRQYLIGGGIGLALLLCAGIYAFSGSPSVEGPGEAIAAQQAAIEAEPPTVTRNFRLDDIGQLRTTLEASGFDAEMVSQLIGAAAPHFAPGQEIRGTLDFTGAGATQQDFARLDLRKRDSSGVVISMEDGELKSTTVSAQLSEQVFVRNGRIDDVSIYTSVLSAGFPNALVDDFFDALAFDFDFAREINPNDSFEIAYRQTVNEAGDPLGAPELLYASMTTPTRTANVYRFRDDEGELAWFDSSGQNIKRALMRTPVDGARISSQFGMRHHPIYNRSRLHGGTDFAAPIGTPIFASGSGVIEIAKAAPGSKRGNGSYIAIQHDNGMRTLYLHMNAFAPGIQAGVRVTQGQTIGEVGNTGGSTGPHLHYEVHINGEKMDPMTVQGSDERQTLSGESLLAFERIRDDIDLSRQLGVEAGN